MSEYKTPFSNLKNNTGKHKDWYSPDFVKIFCQEINPKNLYFENKSFVKKFKTNYLEKELKERLNLIVDLLNEYIEGSYESKLNILRSLLYDPLPGEDGMFTHGFYLYPVSQFIERYGQRDIDKSLDFIEELTMRFTGEWAIRTLANSDKKKVLKRMKLWSSHENFHVRRLSSEGLRAKLPWGKKINWIHSDPKCSLPIYNKLRNDKILYVRRSVANSMGDMIKIDEELAYETMLGWLGKRKTKENLWVIKHAIRTPVKKKQAKFLSLNKKVVSFLKEFSDLQKK